MIYDMARNFFEKKYAVAFIITAIMMGAFIVRAYNHEPWLYFKMDQARDAFLIANAVENGPGELPLLGPRAGATELEHGFLNLGPIFYYFQYLSGVIFHSTAPEVFSYPDLFFSIAVLPLLYVFCRLYFKKYISLIIVTLYAFSFLIIQYSRFAWNPNSLPFFAILSFLALLKMMNTENEKAKRWWTVLWATGLAVGSQLHFVGFFCLVGVSGLTIFFHYDLWKMKNIKDIFKKVNSKRIFILASFFLTTFLFFYIPVIISDVIKSGENAHNFVAALSSKPTKDTSGEKFIRNISEQIEQYTLITTGYVYPKKLPLEGYLASIFTLAIFIFGIGLAIRKIRRDTETLRQDFLKLLLFWFGVFFTICIPLAFQIRPRFFIFTFAVPFLFLGLVFEFLEEKRIKYYHYVIAGLATVVFLANAYSTRAWFFEQEKSQIDDIKVRRTLILKTKDGVTLGELERATDYIYENRRFGAHVYYYIKPEHVRPVKYLLQRKNDLNFRYDSMKINADPNAQYFAIIPTGSEISKIENKFKEEFKIVSSKKFGQISVYEVDFTNRMVSEEFTDAEDGGGSESNRIFWKDVL